MGIIIVAIKRESGEMEFNPFSTSTIQKGNTLVAIGEANQLEELEKMAGV